MCNFCGAAQGPYEVYKKKLWVAHAEFVTVRTLGGSVAGDGLFVDVPAPPEGADAAWIRYVLREVCQMPTADRFNFMSAGRILLPGEKVVEDIKDSFRAEVTIVDSPVPVDPSRSRVETDADRVLLCLRCAHVGGFLSDEDDDDARSGSSATQ